MNIIQKLIAQINKKKSIKILILIFVLLWVFVWKSYANTGDEMSTLDSVTWIFSLILSLASWVWIVLASLAGKMMTNDLVYGTVLHLDATLWKLWNIVKNFSNFALWFFVLYAIAKNIFTWAFESSSGEWSPISVIKKTLIAGVLIQMSRFLVAVLIDLSVIATAAIGSFPAQFIESNQDFQWNITKAVQDKMLQKWKFTFDPKDKENIVRWEPIITGGLSDDPDEIKKLLDTITPSYDSVAGPLLFLWFSVFELNELSDFTKTNDTTNAMDSWSDLFLSAGISAIVVLSFTFMMFLLFIVNNFRINILWLVIVLSPAIILLKVFKFTDKLWDKGIWPMLNVRNVLMLIFKPIFMVWFLSLILVVMVLIKGMISPPGNKVNKTMFEDQWTMVIETVQSTSNNKNYDSTMKVDGLLEFSMIDVKDTIADFIVYLLWLFLVFLLIKMSVKLGKTGIWFIDDSIDAIFNSVQTMITNLPVIPIAGWVWRKALTDKSKILTEAATRLAGIDVAGQNTRIQQLLWVWSFESLANENSKEKFMSQAVSIWRDLNYTFDKLWNDRSFQKELSNRKTRNKPLDISQNDLENVYNWNPSTETTTTPTPTP